MGSLRLRRDIIRAFGISNEGILGQSHDGHNLIENLSLCEPKARRLVRPSQMRAPYFKQPKCAQ